MKYGTVRCCTSLTKVKNFLNEKSDFSTNFWGTVIQLKKGKVDTL